MFPPLKTHVYTSQVITGRGALGEIRRLGRIESVGLTVDQCLLAD